MPHGFCGRAGQWDFTVGWAVAMAPVVFPGSDQFEENFANRRRNESKPETHWKCENNDEETVGWNNAGVDIRVNLE